MFRRLVGGARTRARGLAAVAGVIVGATALAGVANAALSAFAPASGQVSPGGSTTATVDVTPPGLLGLGVSCLVGSAAPSATPGLPAVSITVSFDQVCGAAREVEMTVSASGNATPGSYFVTVRETELLVTGDLLGTYQWPLTVVGSTTSTTTTSSTSTTTTSTPTVTTTTSPATGGTSGSTSTTTTTSQTPPTSMAGSGGSSSPGPKPDDTATDATLPDTPDAEVGDDEDQVIAAPGTSGGGEGGPRNVGESDSRGATMGLSNIAVSDRLRRSLEGTLPSILTDAVLSPLVIGEVLLRSLLENTLGFLLPLAMATAIAMWFVRRMRKDVGRLELEH